VPVDATELPRRASILGAGVVTLTALYLYLRTLHPGVGPSLDSMELQIAVLVDGVIHPPGSPQYLLLGKLAMLALPGPNPAYRLNLLSALAGAATVGITFLLAYRLIRRPGREVAALIASALASLSLASAPRVWYQASVAELYALNALYVALTAYLLLVWSQTRRPGAFWAAVIVYALSFGNHLTMILLLPAFLYTVAITDRTMLLRPRHLAVVTTIVLLSALQYGVIPLRVAADPPFCNFCPSNAALPSYLIGGAFRHAYFALPKRDILARLPESVGQFNTQFMPWGYALGIVGLWELFRRQARIAWLLVWGILAEHIFVIAYAIPDWHDFLTPCYVLFAPLIAEGAVQVWGWLAKRRSLARMTRWRERTLAPSLLGLAALALLGAALNSWWLVDQSQRTEFEANGRALIAEAQPGAWLLMPHPNSAAFYYSWAVRYLAFLEEVPGFSAVTPPEIDPPPGPEPGYRSWASAAPALDPAALIESPRQVLVLDPSEPRVADYGLLPVCVPGTSTIAGYEVVAVRQGEWVTPLVDADRWAAVGAWAVFGGEAATCPR